MVKYITNDGTVFETELEAILHEQHLESKQNKTTIKLQDFCEMIYHHYKTKTQNDPSNFRNAFLLMYHYDRDNSTSLKDTYQFEVEWRNDEYHTQSIEDSLDAIEAGLSIVITLDELKESPVSKTVAPTIAKQMLAYVKDQIDFNECFMGECNDNPDLEDLGPLLERAFYHCTKQ